MATQKNQLAVIENSANIIPTAEDMAVITEELKDIDRITYGRIRLVAGGAGVFKVTEIGEDDSSAAAEIVGIIILSHKCNAYWTGKFGSGGDAAKQPDCASMDDKTGIVAATGECRDCATAPTISSTARPMEGRGKACKNMRRLYILREGDLLPMVLSLPATALRAYDNYRTRLVNIRKTAMGVVTKISLKNAKNADGTEYSTPVSSPLLRSPPPISPASGSMQMRLN